MSEIISAGAYAGVMAGVIMTLFSHVAPLLSGGRFVQDTDEIRVFHRPITRREAHLLGIFIHLTISLLAGMGFAYGVEHGLISGFHILPMLGWATLILLLSGGILMPLEGHGFFGVKHDAWFIVDALLTNLLWGGLYLILIHLWL